MSSAPRSAYQDDDFVIVRMDAVRALGDYNAAGVFQRIAWRCAKGGSGEYAASLTSLAEEICLSRKQVERAVRILLIKGWLSMRQSDGFDRTGIYSVNWEAETGADPTSPQGDVDIPSGGRVTSPQGDVFPSYRQEDTPGDTPVTSTKRPPRRQATEVDHWPGPDRSHGLFAQRQGLDIDAEEERFREAMGASGERRSNWPSSFAAFLSAVADGTDLDAFPSLDEDFGSSGALSVPTL